MFPWITVSLSSVVTAEMDMSSFNEGGLCGQNDIPILLKIRGMPDQC